jgi:hypothetical protein
VAGAVLLPLGLAALGGVVATLPGYVAHAGRRSPSWKQELAGRPVDAGWTSVELRALGASGAASRRRS